MTLQEALTILTTYHAWRIGDDEVHMQKPSEVTKAIGHADKMPIINQTWMMFFIGAVANLLWATLYV